MFYNHKNDINLEHLNTKKHCVEANAVNDETPPASTLKLGRRDNYHEESMPFLGKYDPNSPYPIVSSLMHHNGSNSSGIGSFSGPGNHNYSGPNVRNICQRDGRIVSTDVEDLSTDDDNTCPASNKGVMDEMFDSISSNPASSIMHQEPCHPSALLNSIPPPPSEPPPSTPRDSYQESAYPKGTMMTAGHHGMRTLMDHDHILQQIPGVMDADPIPMSYLMSQTNSRMPGMYSSNSNGPTPMPSMSTMGRYRNQAPMPESAAMSTLPHTHSQNGFGTGVIPRGPGSVGGNSNVYENPYNSLNRQNGKQIKIGPSTGGFPISNSTHDMGYPVLSKPGLPPNHILYRQGSIRSPPHQSFTDPFFGMGKDGTGRCSWNCIRISLFLLAILLLLSLIAYFAAKSVWLEGRLNKRFAQDPVVIGLFDPNHLPVVVVPMRTIPINLKSMGVWSGRWIQNHSDYVHFNFTINAATNLGVFLRINSVPTIVRYSFFERISGNRWKQRIIDPNRNRDKRSADESYQEESTGYVNYLEKGLWFISVVNDQPREENIKFLLNNKVSMKQSCPDSCNKHGLCVEDGRCECFTGFKGRDCSSVNVPKVCSGHGDYFHGRCICDPEWKGIECQTIWYECELSSCSGHGDCVSGSCVCQSGYGGRNCSNVLCPSDCSGHGLCLNSGACKCFEGWTGKDCSKAFGDAYKTRARTCMNGGQPGNDGSCRCTGDYEGPNCERKVCVPTCKHGGNCTHSGKCKCAEGYRGAQCEESLCDARCYLHGRCLKGTCHCDIGWNGKHCTLDGCPNQCSNQGKCILNDDLEYTCSCTKSWKGPSCNISKEYNCTNGIDDDNDRLIDCYDPDCCPTVFCEKASGSKQALVEESCPHVDDLKLLLLTTKLARPGSPFHEQIEFLIKRKYTSSTLNERRIAVVRGRVIQEDGSSFQGCRVQDRLRPSNGHTFTDKQGLFDLVVDGGGLMQLEIIRHPGTRFTGYFNVYVPINEFVNIGDFVLKDMLLPVDEHPSIDHGCSLGDKSVHDSSIVEGPRLLVDWSSEVVPIYDTDAISIAIDNGILVNSIELKETKLKLMHRSSRVKGFKSAVLVVLLGANVPAQLKEIKLRISVAGQIISKQLEPDPYLTYTFYWDRQSAYIRNMYGLAQVKVSAGYVYWNCSQIFWESKLTPINGQDLAAKDIGNWNLNIRHIFDYNHGIVYRGDGSHIFFTETNWRTTAIAGVPSERRDINSCAGCDGVPTEKKFFSLNSVMSDDKGRIIIADGKYIRILTKASQRPSAWVSMAPYLLKFIREMESSSKNIGVYLTKHEINPLSANAISSWAEKFYVSVSQPGSVWMVNLATESHQLVIGDSCADPSCVKEKLVYPKGMAMSYNLSLYLADGRSIKRFSAKDMTITTVVGDASALSDHARLPGCYEGFSASKTRLKWPTSVLYNPIDDSVYFVDNADMVYRLGLKNMVVTVFAGNVFDCPLPPTTSEMTPANRHKFEEIRDISLSPSGELYIAEKRNVWVVKSDGYLYAVAGTKHHGQWQGKGHFVSISSIAVTISGELIVADNDLLQIFSVHYALPTLNNGNYEVLSADTRELYSFNSDGHHVSTDSSVTGTRLYSLHFRLHSINGWLSKIVSPSGKFQFKVHRDTQSKASQLETPYGIKYNVTLDDQKRIIALAAPQCTWRFEYNDQDLLTSIQDCQKIIPYRFSYYPTSGRLQSVIRPSGVTTTFEEHPMFSEYVKKKFGEDKLVKGAGTYRLASAALTPHSSLFYATPPSTLTSNNATNRVLLQLRVVGPSTQIKMAHGFQPKEMSLIDSQFKVQYPTHSIVYYHVNTSSGLRFTRKIHMKTSKPMKPYKSEWSYRISPRLSTSSRSKRSNNQLLRQYAVSNEDYEWNDGGSTLSFGHPRILKINGKKRLHIRYESTIREEYYSTFDGEKPVVLFRMAYNEDFQVTKVTFSNTATYLTDAVVSYSKNGRLSAIHWPKPILHLEYDDLNRIKSIFNAFLNEKLIYMYEDHGANIKVTEISRGKDSSYRLAYDANDKLMSVTTPNGVQVEVTQLISLGYRRILYQPYGVSFNFIYDFESLNGNLFRVIYPSREYQINFFYSTDNQLRDVIYGAERISWSYGRPHSLIHGVLKTDPSRGFRLWQQLQYDGPFLELVNSTVTVPTPTSDLVAYNSLLMYNYSPDLQISKINLLLQASGNGRLDIRLESSLRYDALGHRIQWDEFRFQLDPAEKIKLPQEGGSVTTHYNGNGQLLSRVIAISGNQVSIEVAYNENSNNPLLISSFKIRRSRGGEETDTKLSYYMDSRMVTNVHNVDYIQYKYYEDGRLRSMRINTGAPVEYIYDEKTGLLRKCGLVSYLYNDDGFLTQKLIGQRHEKFSYNAFGLLKEYSLEANKKVLVKMEYFYDSGHRLLLQRDLVRPGAMYQYFYSDPSHPDRLSHMLDSASGQLSTYYYSSVGEGHLFSVRVDKTFYYVLADFIGSPRLIVSQDLEVVWERDYDIFGESKTVKEWKVHMPIGFAGALSDPYSRMVFLGHRIYDPNGKSFAGFDWSSLFPQLSSVHLNPLALNSYQFHSCPHTFDRFLDVDLSGLLSADFWMTKTGLDALLLLGDKALFSSHQDAVALPRHFTIKYAFSQFEDVSVLSSLWSENAATFRQLHSVQGSVLVPWEALPAGLGPRRSPQIPCSLFSFHPNISISLATDLHLRILTPVAEQLDSPFKLIANALFRNTSLLDVYSSRKDLILIFLLKTSCGILRSDLRQLGMLDKSQLAFGHNLNLSTVASTTVPGDDHRHPVTEVLLQQRHFLISVRYCSSAAEQRAVISNEIRAEAETLFWANKRRQLNRHELVQERLISGQQEQDLRNFRLLRDTILGSWHNITEFPILFDDLSAFKIRRRSPSAP